MLATKDAQDYNTKTMEQMRAAFAIWTTPKSKIPAKPEELATPKPKTLAKPQDSATPTKDSFQEPSLKEEDNNSGVAVKDDSPAFSPDASFNTQDDDKDALPLSAANLIRNTEKEEQHLLSRVVNSYSLSQLEIKEVIMTKRVKKWIVQADPEGCREDTESEGFRSGDGKVEGGVKISLEDAVQEHTDAASSSPYILERRERVAAAKERISILNCRNKIQPGIFLFLRHAMHIDAEGLAGVVNSYVRCSGQTLESRPITEHDIIQRIDDSRNQELPFIVAIKQSKEKDFDSRVPWGDILGFARLTNFLQGQHAVACTAQIEIMVAQDSKGQKVGRCLMDAMLTIADPGYSPQGGYRFYSNIPNDTMINGASWSCRPLSCVVAMMSHTNEEKSRCQMIKQWLMKEHKFFERGSLPNVGQKMGQP